MLVQFLDDLLLRLPLGFHPTRALFEIGDLLFDLGQPFLRDGIILAHQRLAFDLALDDLALHFVNLGRKTVNLDAQSRRGLVYQIDRLVRQEPVGDVAV